MWSCVDYKRKHAHRHTCIWKEENVDAEGTRNKCHQHKRRNIEWYLWNDGKLIGSKNVGGDGRFSNAYAGKEREIGWLKSTGIFIKVYEFTYLNCLILLFAVFKRKKNLVNSNVWTYIPPTVLLILSQILCAYFCECNWIVALIKSFPNSRVTSRFFEQGCCFSTA